MFDKVLDELGDPGQRGSKTLEINAHRESDEGGRESINETNFASLFPNPEGANARPTRPA
jgi:hypothetical protein